MREVFYGAMVAVLTRKYKILCDNNYEGLSALCFVLFLTDSSTLYALDTLNNSQNPNFLHLFSFHLSVCPYLFISYSVFHLFGSVSALSVHPSITFRVG